MGILDNVTSAMNRGSESVGRATEKARLKSQLNELNKKRQNLAAQLGAALYQITKDSEVMREGYETLYDGIAACDVEREQIQHRIAELDAASQAAATASTSFKCTVCGATVAGDDLFCSGCGTPIDQAHPAAVTSAKAASGKTCASCGASMAEDDMFCMSCGARVEESTQEEAVLLEELSVDDVTVDVVEEVNPVEMLGGER